MLLWIWLYRCEMHSNCLEVTLFSSFWLINKTDLMLSYKVDTETVGVLYHPSEYEGPIFFTFRSQNYFNKKTCAIRVDNGDWSKKIPLDVAGSSGFVTCKIRDKSYQVNNCNMYICNIMRTIENTL